MGRTDMLKAGDDVSSLVYYLDGYCAVLCFLFSYEAAHLSIIYSNSLPGKLRGNHISRPRAEKNGLNSTFMTIPVVAKYD